MVESGSRMKKEHDEIVLDKCCRLACATCTHEGIHNGVAFAQVCVVRTVRAKVLLSRQEWTNSERCGRLRRHRSWAQEARGILTTAIACGLQVCRDFTRTLTERVICLDETIVVKGTSVGNITVSYPAPRSRVRAICGTNLSNHRARGEQQGCECGED